MSQQRKGPMGQRRKGPESQQTAPERQVEYPVSTELGVSGSGGPPFGLEQLAYQANLNVSERMFHPFQQEYEHMAENQVSANLFTQTAINCHTAQGAHRIQVLDPQVLDPQVSDPQVSDPQVLDPQVSDPQVSDPQVSDPQVSDPQVSDPQVSDPQVLDPQVSHAGCQIPQEGFHDCRRDDMSKYCDVEGDQKYHCPYEGTCERGPFVSGYVLKRHLISSTHGEGYTCNICHRLYSRRDVLKDHIQNIHSML